jgi:hypothetical protein
MTTLADLAAQLRTVARRIETRRAISTNHIEREAWAADGAALTGIADDLDRRHNSVDAIATSELPHANYPVGGHTIRFMIGDE